MDLDEFRAVLRRTGVDVWTFIDVAIDVAAVDCADQIRLHRDRIVERLFSTSTSQRCHNCHPAQPQPQQQPNRDVAPRSNFSSHANASGVVNNKVIIGGGGGASTPPSPYSPQSIYVEEEDQEAHKFEEYDPSIDVDVDLHLDDEQTKILAIKEHLEDPYQSEDYLVELLQGLADMDITFKALKETDIGRHVNRLRKHSSNEVRRLVKQLVRKWKDLVDEWVKINAGGGAAHTLIADGDSPHQKLTQNGHHQVPDFALSPNQHNGSSGSEKTNGEAETAPRSSKVTARREAAAARPPQTSSLSSASLAHNKQREKRVDIDLDRLASASKRLQQNYQEAQNAKKQRTIQVMDIHEIPKPKNAFIARNKGGGAQGHGRHW